MTMTMLSHVRRLSQYRRLIAVSLILISIISTSSCAGNPPPGTYSTQGTRAYNAVQLLKDINAMSQTAINLNAQQGKLHLTDLDTSYVRSFALSAATSLNAYGTTPATNLGVVARGFQSLTQSLSASAKANSTFAKVLAIVAAGVNSLPTQ